MNVEIIRTDFGLRRDVPVGEVEVRRVASMSATLSLPLLEQDLTLGPIGNIACGSAIVLCIRCTKHGLLVECPVLWARRSDFACSEVAKRVDRSITICPFFVH